MSAVNTNLGDREHEALRRAQRAHEPSMEEILASIRTIIAEEREPVRASEPKTAAKAAAPPAPPQVVFSRREPAAGSAPAAPAQPVAAAQPVTPAQPAPPDSVAAAAEVDTPRVVWRHAGSPAAEPTPKASAADNAPLLSPETDKAVASAFEALSSNLAARSAELAEGLAREMLRPMLKTWLDDNLPAIVERLVRAEIERVVRGTP